MGLTEKGKRDLKLINRALETGDTRAYNELMRLYRDPLYFMLFEKVGNEEINNILSILKLDNYKNKKINTLSLGQIKKLELIRLIIENKRYWILDEPFTNLDTETIDIIAQSFEDHCKNEGSILFSTHQDVRFKMFEEITL